jgi:hypothetical protein
LSSDKGAQQYATGENQVPRFGFPIVLEEIKPIGHYSGADMTEGGTYSKGPIQ